MTVTVDSDAFVSKDLLCNGMLVKILSNECQKFKYAQTHLLLMASSVCLVPFHADCVVD